MGPPLAQFSPSEGPFGAFGPLPGGGRSSEGRAARPRRHRAVNINTRGQGALQLTVRAADSAGAHAARTPRPHATDEVGRACSCGWCRCRAGTRRRSGRSLRSCLTLQGRSP
eukprot:scaffold2285_cov380-Prasinococcus_capsulatus_cf.AAC.9